ncbi:MAG: SHOCT domain-containing protein [Methanoregula sp.]|uniref:SHOCT domain-containing protein n=1 Tax=Methanoregula sp. TaxID=2052170 RepID=UPI003D0ED66A
MAYNMMDSMWGGNYGYGYGFPFFGVAMMLFWLVVFIAIAYLVYKDANSRGMNGLLWFILVIIPMIGIVFLIIYVIIRETGAHKTVEGIRTPMDILKERYAKGEITGEQFQKMSEDLKK